MENEDRIAELATMMGKVVSQSLAMANNFKALQESVKVTMEVVIDLRARVEKLEAK